MGAGTILCITAPTLELLIAGRFLLDHHAGAESTTAVLAEAGTAVLRRPGPSARMGQGNNV